MLTSRPRPNTDAGTKVIIDMSLPPLLLGCGIFAKEIGHLIAKNGWEVETVFLDSALHNYLQRLEKGLTGSLAKRHGRDIVVFYGCCHPLIDRWISSAGATRVVGQNCVEILLGKERFDRELENGAFFLLEEWALRWDRITRELYGANPEVIREIFRGELSRMLAIRTPCSANFSALAEAAAEKVGLPLEWTDVGLEHLEQVLETALRNKLHE
ncbi:DUF1638 domain-containing protein [Gammaproteobacteria bacterium]